MDTSGYLPQLGDDDPLFEIAQYTQLMKTKLNDDRCMIFLNSGFAWGTTAWDAGPLTEDISSTLVSQRTTGQAFASPGSSGGTIKFNETGIYFVEWVVIPGGDPGTAGYRIVLNGTWPGNPTGVDTFVGQENRMAGGRYWESFVSTYIRVPQTGLELKFIGIQSAGTTNAARIRIVKTGNL
jgi:hypothetical protein